MATLTECLVVLVGTRRAGGQTLSTIRAQQGPLGATGGTIPPGGTGGAGRLAGCTLPSFGVEPGRADGQTSAQVEQRLRVSAAFTSVWSSRAGQAVCMAANLVTLGAAPALLDHSQASWGAGGAGAQVAGHLGVEAFALAAASVGPPGQVLVGLPLVDTSRFHRGAFRATFPRQVNELRALWAVDPSTLGPLAEHLAPVAGAELAPGGVPHVAVVTHGALIQAAPLGGGALVAAPPGPPHFGVALVAGEGPTGVGVASGLTSVAHTCGAGVLLPLLAVLILFPSRQTRVGDTLRTALAGRDHQVLMRLAGDLPTLRHRTLDLAVAADTSGAAAGFPLLAVPVGDALPGARGSVASTLRAALSSRCERTLIG